MILYVILFILSLFVINYFNNATNTKCDKHFIINTLIRGCARWAAASQQDKSPLVAVLHANYASGYLWAIRDVFSDTDIKSATGIDIIQFQKRITNTQDLATKQMIKSCPQYSGGIDRYLGSIAGE